MRAASQSASIQPAAAEAPPASLRPHVVLRGGVQDAARDMSSSTRSARSFIMASSFMSSDVSHFVRLVSHAVCQ